MTDRVLIRWRKLEDWCEHVVRNRRKLICPWVHLCWEWVEDADQLAAECHLHASAVFPSEIWFHAGVYGRCLRSEWAQNQQKGVYAVETYESTRVILEGNHLQVLPGKLERK